MKSQASGGDAPNHLEIQGIRKTFGSHVALDSVSVGVRRGELFCLLGPSGCGKTTLLNLIGGLLTPDAGSIKLNGRDITSTPMQKRNVGIVFQSYALFTHMTVRENIAFGMRVRKLSSTEIDRRVNGLLEMTRMTGKEGRYPKQLSGGEQQRVAIARALATDPDLLLLDEPFSNLDAKLRVELRSEVHRVQREAGISMIIVTHDQDEAFSLGDRVALLNQGEIVQVGSPEELYAKPVTSFAAQFVGESNILAGPVESQAGQVGIVSGGHFIPLPGTANGGGTQTVLIRPERTTMQRTKPAQSPSFSGVVTEVNYRGVGWQYAVKTDVGRLLILESTADKRSAEVGSDVFVTWDPKDSFVLPLGT